MMINISIENVLEEIVCPDSPSCKQEHWRDTGGRRLRLNIGAIGIPLPRLLLGFVTGA